MPTEGQIAEWAEHECKEGDFFKDGCLQYSPEHAERRELALALQKVEAARGALVMQLKGMLCCDSRECWRCEEAVQTLNRYSPGWREK